MKKKSDEILKLLGGGEKLKEARLKALKVTREIQGFGGSMTSSPSSSSEASTFSSFLSCSTTTTPTWNDINELNKFQLPFLAKESPESYSRGGINDKKSSNFPAKNKNVEGSHLWDCPEIQETGSLLDAEDVEGGKTDGVISGICSKLVGISPSRGYNNGEKVGFRSVSDAGRTMKKTYDRQHSLWY
jgi:epsin